MLSTILSKQACLIRFIGLPLFKHNRLEMPKIVATKEQWIKLGYELFSEAGIMGLNVEVMSKRLKCNRSSFYWHFKSKDDFVDNLVDFWTSLYTNGVIAEANKEKDPHKKLFKLIAITLEEDSNLDFIFYLKKYGEKNKRIKTVVDQIDSKRIDFGIELLKELGYSKEDALFKSVIVYKYLIGHHEMMKYKKRPKNYPVAAKNEIIYILDLKM